MKLILNTQSISEYIENYTKEKKKKNQCTTNDSFPLFWERNKRGGGGLKIHTSWLDADINEFLRTLGHSSSLEISSPDSSFKR